MRLPRRSSARRLAWWPGGRGRWALTLGAPGSTHCLAHLCLPLRRLLGADDRPRAVVLQRRLAGRWRPIERWSSPGRWQLAALPGPVAARDLRLVWQARRAPDRLALAALRRPARHEAIGALAALGHDLLSLEPENRIGVELRMLGLRRPAGPGAAPLAGLELAWYGRFGNNVMQLVHALALAEHHGLLEVALPAHPLFRLSSAGLAPPAGSPALVERGAPPRGARLRGLFYHLHLLPALRAILDPACRRRLAQQRVRPLLDPALWQAPGDPPELVIHLRGGDIFGAAPHPHYVQPPLAFYRRAVAERREPLTAVRLVSEDRANPCLVALEDWLARQGLACRVQSGSFAADLATLLGARRLVASATSFSGAVVLLSDRLAELYSFAEGRGPFGGGGGLLPFMPAAATAAWGVRHVGLQDRAGGYIPRHQWRNSPEQRQLMLDYPDEALVLESSPL